MCLTEGDSKHISSTELLGAYLHTMLIGAKVLRSVFRIEKDSPGVPIGGNALRWLMGILPQHSGGGTIVSRHAF
jgi:hypothetical protein